jgi:hypothetical protein
VKRRILLQTLQALFVCCDFLYENFISEDAEDSGVIPRLDSSQTTPPVATSTPQHSFRMSFENSQFKSSMCVCFLCQVVLDCHRADLLDRDSEMQNAIEALDSSTDNFSDRSGLGILLCHKEEVLTHL